MRCAIYSRVSTEDQAREGFSLASQQKALHKIAAERGYTVALSVSDDISGATLERPGLSRVRDMARTKQISALLVYDPDRLSRSLGHLCLLMDEFAAADVRVEFATQNNQTQEDRLLLNMRGAFGEYERTKILERTKRGQRERASRGLRVGGCAPFGYTDEGGKLAIHPQEAALVRHIFMRYTQGASIRQITREISTSDLRPRRGGVWQKTSVAWILSSPVYIGEGQWNKTRAGKERRIRRASSDWITVPAPAIIPRDTWSAAQARRDENRSVLGGRPTRRYLLKGFMVCAGCGRRMCGSVSGRGLRSYRCSGRCGKNNYMPADLAEKAIMDAVNQTLGSAEEFAGRLVAHLDKIRSCGGSAEKLQRHLDSLVRRERNALLLLTDHLGTDHGDVLKAQIAETQRRRREIEQQIEALRAGDVCLSDAERARAEIARRLKYVMSHPEHQRDLLTRIIGSVRVDGKRLFMVLKVSSTLQHSGQFHIEVEANVA